MEPSGEDRQPDQRPHQRRKEAPTLVQKAQPFAVCDADETAQVWIALIWEIEPPWYGYITVLPALVLSGLMLGALGLLLSSAIRQLENFASVMNFVIFPMFFASPALYPLWHVKEASLILYDICEINPFTHAVELIRFALYGQLEPVSAVVLVATTAIFLTLAVYGYDPAKGLMARRAAE